MKEIPKWIIKVIEREKLNCRHCKKNFNVDNLMSIGIQESSRSPYGDYLCIGMFCTVCKELLIFELKEMTLIDFAFEILDQETSNKIKKNIKKDEQSQSEQSEQSDQLIKKKARRKSTDKSNITSKEITEVRNFLKDKNLLHEEFLIALGMSPEEIKTYNYKNRE